MENFDLTPDVFTDLAEHHDASGFFSTQAAFIATRDLSQGDPLNASWQYTTNPFISFIGTALVITVTNE